MWVSTYFEPDKHPAEKLGQLGSSKVVKEPMLELAGTTLEGIVHGYAQVRTFQGPKVVNGSLPIAPGQN